MAELSGHYARCYVTMGHFSQSVLFSENHFYYFEGKAVSTIEIHNKIRWLTDFFDVDKYDAVSELDLIIRVFNNKYVNVTTIE